MRIVKRIMDSMPTSDGAGVKLKRVIGRPGLDQIDPFLMLDEFYSDNPNDYIAGFPNHPHRGFETLTYMIEGKMRHEDNHGGNGLLETGGAQYMTAGRGVIHSEMPEQTDGLMRGLQLWINLPADKKMTEPRYQDLQSADLPVYEKDGARVKLVSGSIDGHTSPALSAHFEPLYLDVTMQKGQMTSFTPDDDMDGFIYVLDGKIKAGPKDSARQSVQAGKMAELQGDGDLTIESKADTSRFVIIMGKPIKEPIAKYGPFVMNTRQQIIEAVQDYEAGKF